MTRYAGRHRAAAPPSTSAASGPPIPTTVELGPPTAVVLPTSSSRSRRSRAARSAGAVVALSLLAVGTVDVMTTTAGGVLGQDRAALPVLPPEAGPQAVAYRADLADLSDRRAEVRAFRAEADAATARAAAAQAAAKAAADAAAAAAAEAQRQAAAQQAARNAQRDSLIDNARKDPRGAARALLADFGFADSQFSCLNLLWTRESKWLYTATNAYSGAYGIPQSLPASKMASAGADYRTNPVTQIKWGLGYIKQVYGTPCNAWAHSQSTGWY